MIVAGLHRISSWRFSDQLNVRKRLSRRDFVKAVARISSELSSHDIDCPVMIFRGLKVSVFKELKQQFWAFLYVDGQFAYEGRQNRKRWLLDQSPGLLGLFPSSKLSQWLHNTYHPLAKCWHYSCLQELGLLARMLEFWRLFQKLTLKKDTKFWNMCLHGSGAIWVPNPELTIRPAFMVFW